MILPKGATLEEPNCFRRDNKMGEEERLVLSIFLFFLFFATFGINHDVIGLADSRSKAGKIARRKDRFSDQIKLTHFFTLTVGRE